MAEIWHLSTKFGSGNWHALNWLGVAELRLWRHPKQLAAAVFLCAAGNAVGRSLAWSRGCGPFVSPGPSVALKYEAPQNASSVIIQSPRHGSLRGITGCMVPGRPKAASGVAFETQIGDPICKLV